MTLYNPRVIYENLFNVGSKEPQGVDNVIVVLKWGKRWTSWKVGRITEWVDKDP